MWLADEKWEGYGPNVTKPSTPGSSFTWTRGVMTDKRDFADASGVRWRAEIITGGRTSPYLNQRVHRPIVQFSCRDRKTPTRYASLPDADPTTFSRLTSDELTELLERARSH